MKLLYILLALPLLGVGCATKVPEIKSSLNENPAIERSATSTNAASTDAATKPQILNTEKPKQEAKSVKKDIPAPEIKSQAQLETAAKERKDYDPQLLRIIAKAKEYAGIFENAVKETSDFESTIRATMSKYPNEASLQQSGLKLLNENSNLASVSRKLISIETELANKLTSYLGLGILPPADELSRISDQYDDYYLEYQMSNDRIKLLMDNFLLNEKTILQKLILERQQELEDLRNSQNYSPPVQESDPQIEAAFSALQTTLSNISDQPVSMSVITRQKEKTAQNWMAENPIIFSSQNYISRFNSILAANGLYWMMIQ